MSNLNEAAKAFLISKDIEVIEVTDVYIEEEHEQGYGCGQCGDDCDYSTSLDVWYTRTRKENDFLYFNETEDSPAGAVWSQDVGNKEVKEFLEFLASWAPSA